MTDNAHVAMVFNSPDLVDEAVRRGVEQAIERHRLLGHKIAIWYNGQPALVTVEQADELKRTNPQGFKRVFQPSKAN